LQWVTSTADKPKKHRLYVICGEDETLRADAVDRIVRLVAPQERVTFYLGRDVGETSPGELWDAVTTQPMLGITKRLVIAHHADRIWRWDPLFAFVDGASVYPETTLVLVVDRPALGKRQRAKNSVPGVPVWETVYEPWEERVRGYSGATVLACSPLSADAPEYRKPSQAQRWLSMRLPVTQPQTEYLWSRVGGDSLLARDVVRSLRLVGVTDATAMAYSDFTAAVDMLVGRHGAEDFVDHLLFDRRNEALTSVVDAGFDAAEWSRIVGLLGQRLDWLHALHGALATNERLDQVMRRLNIHQKWILHYAHRENAKHNIARKYDTSRVAQCRLLLARLDKTLSASGSVPPGFGAALIASW
jgi:hypothetical protein